MRSGTVLAIMLTLAAPAMAQTDAFAGNARASLHLRIDLSGAARVNFPNGIEWAGINAVRSLDLTYQLVDVGNDGVPIVGGLAEGAVPQEMRDLEARMAECGDNQVCLAGVMMQFAQGGMGQADGRNPFEAMVGMQPGRYVNLAGDRSGTCAEGVVEVRDRLHGVTIPPPNPAVAYDFPRTGSLSLPQRTSSGADAVCGVEVSLDTATGSMSLRLPLGSISVPVTLGPGAFTDEGAVAFVEGRGTLELVNQAPAGGEWTGAADVTIGSASHNSGQVSAALSGRVSWSLSMD